MSDVRDELRAAYEDEGYDVDEVTENRGLVRVVVLDGEGDDLESIAADALGETRVLGVDATTESVEGHDGVSTVVSVRHRA